jgi:hypothetical protein
VCSPVGVPPRRILPSPRACLPKRSCNETSRGPSRATPDSGPKWPRPTRSGPNTSAPCPGHAPDHRRLIWQVPLSGWFGHCPEGELSKPADCLAHRTVFSGIPILSVTYEKLTQLLPIRAERYRSLAQRQLDPAIGLLTSAGVIEGATWADSKHGIGNCEDSSRRSGQSSAISTVSGQETNATAQRPRKTWPATTPTFRCCP